MNVMSDPRDMARAIVIADYGALENSIEIVRERRAGNQAAIAVAFEDKNGVRRRGVIGLRSQPDGRWRPSGSFMGSAHRTGERDVWMTWGGWGGDSHDRAVLGGWVADSATVIARAIDDLSGRTLEDAVENGVAVFLYDGDFGLHRARLELIDREGKLLRKGPLNSRP
jgi:hypothetical protein